MKNHQTKTQPVKNPSKTSITVEKCIKTKKKLKNSQKFTKKNIKNHRKRVKKGQKHVEKHRKQSKLRQRPS